MAPQNWNFSYDLLSLWAVHVHEPASLFIHGLIKSSCVPLTLLSSPFRLPLLEGKSNKLKLWRIYPHHQSNKRWGCGNWQISTMLSLQVLWHLKLRHRWVKFMEGVNSGERETRVVILGTQQIKNSAQK